MSTTDTCHCHGCETLRVQREILNCLKSIDARLSGRPVPLPAEAETSKLLYSVAEAAQMLGISRSKAYELVYRALPNIERLPIKFGCCPQKQIRPPHTSGNRCACGETVWILGHPRY